MPKLKNTREKVKLEMKMISFKTKSVFRRLSEDLDSDELRHIRKLFGCEEVVRTVSVKRIAKARREELWFYNGHMTLMYDTSNQHVWPQIHSRVAILKKRPMLFYTVYSVFGNIFYQPYACAVTCTAVQRLSNAAIISRLLRDEDTGGYPLSVSIKRISVAGNLGRHIQVTFACMLETMLAHSFKDSISIVHRTEERCNSVYFTVLSVKRFLTTGEQNGFIGRNGMSGMEDSLSPYADALRTNVFKDCRVHVHVTYVGNTFFRFAWDQEHLQIPYEDLEKTESLIRNASNAFVAILKFLC